MAADLTILFIGDVVGRPGRRIARRGLAALRRERTIDFAVANAENAAGGSGITAGTVEELLGGGMDCLTTGDHAFKQAEGVKVIETDSRVLRPLNLGARAVGRGLGVYETADGVPVAVINAQGQTFMKPIDNPFRALEAALEELGDRARVILVDMHAEATSEKVAMGRMLDGRVSAVLGTHTHIPTADEQVLPEGTAYITDVGMTGPYDSVLGRRTDRVLAAILTGMPQRFDVAARGNRLCGAIVTVDPDTGRARAIERVCVAEDDLAPDPKNAPPDGPPA